MKPPPPRPEKDFTIHSVEWDREIAGRYAAAGFVVPGEERICERFWLYLDFLQSHRLTCRVVAASREAVGDKTALRNSDMTDTGFRFIQSIEKKWSGRLLKAKDITKERALLQKWLAAFETEVPNTHMHWTRR